MTSIVLELQKEIVEPNNKLADILRKAYIIAKKLQITDFENWLHSELNGYKKHEPIPEYRETEGVIQYWHQFRGWSPAIILDENIRKKITITKNSQGIPELELLLENSKHGIEAPLPDEISKLFNFNTKYRLEISPVSIHRITETVKNIIIEWLLKLENDGILGDGISFSQKEKESIIKQNYTVNNIFENISGSQIQQYSNNSSQIMENQIEIDKIIEIITLLKDNSREIDIENNNEIIDAIKTIEEEIRIKTPQVHIIKQSMGTIKNILEGVIGSLIASGILYKISQLNIF